MNKSNKISISIISDVHAMANAHQIRQTVFVEEQNVAPEIEYDEFERSSTHILATLDGLSVGTARWRLTSNGYKLERFAVLAENRGQGVGEAMVSFILDRIETDDPIYLNSQVSAMDFYAKRGFKAEGEIFFEANIPHRKMFYAPI